MLLSCAGKRLKIDLAFRYEQKKCFCPKIMLSERSRWNIVISFDSKNSIYLGLLPILNQDSKISRFVNISFNLDEVYYYALEGCFSLESDLVALQTYQNNVIGHYPVKLKPLSFVSVKQKQGGWHVIMLKLVIYAPGENVRFWKCEAVGPFLLFMFYFLRFYFLFLIIF